MKIHFYIYLSVIVLFIISIRQTKPCLGWNGVRMWTIEVCVYVTVL